MHDNQPSVEDDHHRRPSVDTDCRSSKDASPDLGIPSNDAPSDPHAAALSTNETNSEITANKDDDRRGDLVDAVVGIFYDDPPHDEGPLADMTADPSTPSSSWRHLADDVDEQCASNSPYAINIDDDTATAAAAGQEADGIDHVYHRTSIEIAWMIETSFVHHAVVGTISEHAYMYYILLVIFTECTGEYVADPSLPPGWFAIAHGDHVYYENPHSGEQTWIKPTC
ncbi:hypothetical protein AaE_010318 [Aphanomyces astaci]|uniref:WW domain-containing protein n=1 Tax=Aphanomyces astaci TaxID=112090 RepID=A0A6A5A987_APHAT|nr:hypothetical protein AaE_010318 [Aphanomyces astaci]